MRATFCNIKWIEDRDTGKFKGMGVLEFADAATALKAVEMKNETEVLGRTMYCRLDKPKPKSDGPVRQPKAKPDGCCKLYCGNLSYDIDDAALRAFFEPLALSAIRWVTDRETGDFKGCGFAEFASTEDADEAFLKQGQVLDVAAGAARLGRGQAQEVGRCVEVRRRFRSTSFPVSRRWRTARDFRRRASATPREERGLPRAPPVKMGLEGRGGKVARRGPSPDRRLAAQRRGEGGAVGVAGVVGSGAGRSQRDNWRGRRGENLKTHTRLKPPPKSSSRPRFREGGGASSQATSFQRGPQRDARAPPESRTRRAASTLEGSHAADALKT